MRHLIKSRGDPSDTDRNGDYTIDAALEQMFSGDQQGGKCVIEAAGGLYRQASVPSEYHFDLVRRQLWLYAMRNFRKLPQPRRDCGRSLLAKPELENADKPVLDEFSALARRLGFHCPETEHSGTHPPTMRGSEPDRCRTTRQKPPQRCGLPSEDSYERDAPQLFIQNIHREPSDQEITSFFVRRSVYLAFFGPCQFDLTTSTLEELNSPIQTLMVYREPLESSENPEETRRKRRRVQGADVEKENGAAQAYATSSHQVTIVFKAFRDGLLHTQDEVTVDRTDPAKVEEAARRFMMSGWRIFSTKKKPILARDAFNSALSSGQNTVLLLPEGNVSVDDGLQRAVLDLSADSQTIEDER